MLMKESLGSGEAKLKINCEIAMRILDISFASLLWQVILEVKLLVL